MTDVVAVGEGRRWGARRAAAVAAVAAVALLVLSVVPAGAQEPVPADATPSAGADESSTTRAAAPSTASGTALNPAIDALPAIDRAVVRSHEWFQPGLPYEGEWADATVLRVGPIAYATATNTGGSHLPVAWSTDYRTWAARTDYEGSSPYGSGDPQLNDALVARPGWPTTVTGHNWLRSELWAPTIAKVGNQFVAYAAVRMAAGVHRFCIFTATAASPMGPYTGQSSPLICQGKNEPSGQNSTTNAGGYIDPDVFTDTDGSVWLLFKSEGGPNCNYPKIWARKLINGGLAFSGSAVQLLTRAQPCGAPDNWEGGVIENPSMVRYKGRYLLFYSANEWVSSAYATGYAVCSKVTGPCSRPSGSPLLRTGGSVSGPGGGDAFIDPRGRLLLMYQSWASRGGSMHRLRRTAQLSWDGTRVGLTTTDMSWGGSNDYLWRFDGAGNFTSTAQSVSGTYTPVAGRFKGGDAKEEILWSGQGTLADSVGSFNAALAMSTTAVTYNTTGMPVAGDFDGDGDDDVFWYAPGPKTQSGGQDTLWRSNASSINATVTALAFDGFGYPVVGDFTGDGADDIFWVTPGSASEILWDFPTGTGVPTSSNLGNKVTGDYQPLVGEYTGDGVDDILWYAPGTVPDYLWDFNGGAFAWTNKTFTANGVYEPFTGDLNGNDIDDIMWFAPGATADYRWFFNAGGTYTSRDTTINGYYSPTVLDANGDGTDDVFWYS